jgi:uncharacterized protein YoxC
MNLEIAATILIIVIFLMIALAIPLFLQLRKTVKSADVTLQTLNQCLPGILKNLEEITVNVNKATFTVNKQIENISHVIQRVQGTVEIFLDLERDLRSSLSEPLLKTTHTVTAVLKGVQAFIGAWRSSR